MKTGKSFIVAAFAALFAAQLTAKTFEIGSPDGRLQARVSDGAALKLDDPGQVLLIIQHLLAALGDERIQQL